MCCAYAHHMSAAESPTRGTPRRTSKSRLHRAASATTARIAGGYASRVHGIESTLGSSAAVARLIGVDRSRVTRWKQGEEPSPQKARELVDLDHVIARARLVLHEDVITTWLESPNLVLNGATPLDRIRSGHADEAVEALEAYEEGAFA